MDQTLVFNLNQAAIDGIRAAGATSQYILVEGNSWSGAWTWVSATWTCYPSILISKQMLKTSVSSLPDLIRQRREPRKPQRPPRQNHLRNAPIPRQRRLRHLDRLCLIHHRPGTSPSSHQLAQGQQEKGPIGRDGGRGQRPVHQRADGYALVHGD